jgi:crotonobetainyl-CoA:carnitine CoA-transferase CaiB-like acyl-CoA transferase
MMFADNGARVIKVEPPEGDRLREEFLSAFLVWNRGKESLVADLRTDEGRAEVQRLAEGADVVIEAFGHETSKRFGVDADALRARNPRLVHCSIKGFPAKSAYADLKGFDGVVAAKVGSQIAMPGQDRPKFSNFSEPSYGAAQLGVQGILAALIVREQTGRGQAVESTLYQGLFPYDVNSMITWHVQNRRQDLLPPGDSAANIGLISERLCTKDGRWVEFMSILPHQFKAYIRAIGMDSLWDDPDFEGAPMVAPEKREAIRTKLFERFRQRTLEEWMPDLLAEPDCVFEPLVTTEEAMRHPQAVHNGAVVEVDDPQVGKMTQAAFPAAFSETPTVTGRPSPVLGEHGPLPRPQAAPAPAEGAAPRPLEGVTVLELANFMATPVAMNLLASLGARVIKVEDIKGDPWRHMMGGISGVQTLEGKESLALDLRLPEAREVLHRLVAKADVFVYGFRAGMEQRLGADYATLKAINPKLIYMNAAGYGGDGPYALRPMYGNTTRALSGGTYRQGGAWLDPERARTADVDGLKDIASRLIGNGSAGGDPESAMGRASTLLMALLETGRSGNGQFIDTSMLNLNAFANSEDFNSYVGKSPMTLPDEGALGLGALYRLYPAKEGWVFLGAPEQADFEAFAAAAAPELAADARFATADARAANDGALAEAIEAVLAGRSAAEWEAELTPKGIGCVAVSTGTIGDFSITDPGILPAGLVAEVDSPRFGRYPRHGAPVTLSESPATLGPAPEVGEHSEAILVELGYSPDEIEGMAESKVVGLGSLQPA